MAARRGTLVIVAIALLAPMVAGEGAAPQAAVSQYGITWSFAEPARVGRYVTGDWWVVGPVTVTQITPAASATHPVSNPA